MSYTRTYSNGDILWCLQKFATMDDENTKDILAQLNDEARSLLLQKLGNGLERAKAQLDVTHTIP